ncbi:hypothetical protein B0H11DRAFT_1944234 [Mycena galericulata]|nr:hypothetical protein B0H11DRAFT_1944234 [Mycena galericulata]
MRQKEQLELLEEEMCRTLQFLQWRANWWRDMAGIRPPPPADEADRDGATCYSLTHRAYAEGNLAYARRQAARLVKLARQGVGGRCRLHQHGESGAWCLGGRGHISAPSCGEGRAGGRAAGAPEAAAPRFTTRGRYKWTVVVFQVLACIVDDFQIGKSPRLKPNMANFKQDAVDDELEVFDAVH